MTSHTLALNVEELSRNCQLCKIMKGFTVGKGHLHVKPVAKVSDKECPT